ncbi:CHAT domain-containing protein [Streptomyces sp. NPDC050658]|uniref:CHAT domain-containing protein n=1 Tax=unclassified Streptomyces TaxID=2593676 RepID=UPI003449FC18
MRDQRLEGERAEVLDRIAGLPSDADEVPALCAYAGELSYRIHLSSDGESGTADLELAAEAFGLAFAAPGTDGDWAAWRIAYAHARALQYDIDPSPQLLDECRELLIAGMAALSADDPAYDTARTVGGHQLALCARERFMKAPQGTPPEDRSALLDEALRRCEDADGILEPGSKEAVELWETLSLLRLERCLDGGGAEDAVACATYCRAVLEAALPGTDLPLVRHRLGVVLLIHGRLTADRDELEEARDAFDTAVHAARRRGAEESSRAESSRAETPWVEPSWVWEAECNAVFVRVLIWTTWKDHAHAAAGEVELKTLLAAPDAEERLVPHFLDGFGRLLYERAAARGDAAGCDRGIALMRRAISEWRPERDGKVTATAVLLGYFQQARYEHDPDPRRVADAAGAAGLVLADEQAHPEIRRMARLLAAWARQEGPDGPPERDDDVIALYEEFVADVEEGRTFLDFTGGDADFPGMFAGADPVRLHIAFDTAYARWKAAEPGRDRAKAATMLLSHLRVIDPHGDRVTAEQKNELIAAALEHAKDDPEWQRTAHMAAGAARLTDAMAGSGDGMDAVLDHFAQAEELGKRSGNTAGDDGLDLARILAISHRGQTSGGKDDVEAARAGWRALRHDPRLPTYARRVMDAQQSSVDAQNAVRAGDLAAADRHRAAVIGTHAALDPEDPSRIELWTLVELDRMLRDDLAERLGEPPAPPLVGSPSAARLRRDANRLPRDHRAWVLGDTGVARFARAGRTQNAADLAEALGLVQEAYDLVDEGSDSKVRYANCLGTGHTALAGIQRDPRARDRHLAQGIARFEYAFAAVGGPEHRLYAATGLGLARAYRHRGSTRHDDRANARRIGLDALRGHAWAALLQSGTDHAAQAASQATSAALEVAGWCLRDNVPEEAVRALDACRGLVLHAATTSSTVPERLVAAGHADLAAEWDDAGVPDGLSPADPLSATQAPLAVPSALRRRVLAALTGEEAAPGDGTPQDRLLDPPTPVEIAAALRTLRKDALVYLVPASADGGGAAVVVTNGGDTHSVPLPKLTEDAAPLRDYLPAGDGAREMGPVPGYAAAHRPLAGPSPRERLDRLCGWAWYAAMRPLFDAFEAPRRPGRVPRLVLVPMGALGLVPWHAAWDHGDDGGRRYALEDAEISYAASARLLCDVAARDAVTHTGQALVVGNPTGDLRYAGEEADAVQRAFYPQGVFLGGRTGGTSDGPGTPAEVMSWLRRSGDQDSGAVLHLACHAAVARGGARSSAHLSLHGGELSAEQLTEALSGGGRGRLGLVLLAACRSHVSGRGHNEAYTLSTAFLVAGARSVIGSLWPVPDDATSVLMFLTHHYLRTEDEPPAKALRRAQLWMLNPHRTLPEALPPLLRARAEALTPDDLTSWAGFTHLGQ